LLGKIRFSRLDDKSGKGVREGLNEKWGKKS
jgi:hypothetical protein